MYNINDVVTVTGGGNEGITGVVRAIEKTDCETYCYIQIPGGRVIPVCVEYLKYTVNDKTIGSIADLVAETMKLAGLKDSDLNRKEEDEMQSILIDEDKRLRDKANKYDLIAETVFMASGVIADGESFSYIIDPEIICDEVVKILANDLNLDRGVLIQKKKDLVNRHLNW